MESTATDYTEYIVSGLCVVHDVFRGFKDARTVELLLQRARRLQHNSEQKQKFSELGQFLSRLCVEPLHHVMRTGL